MTTIFTKDKRNIRFMTGYVRDNSMWNTITNILRDSNNMAFYQCTNGVYRTSDGKRYIVRP